MPGRKSQKFDRCMKQVSARGGVSSPGAVCAASVLHRKNPIDGAAELSEVFHGRPAESLTEIVEQFHEHSVLADLGRLNSITLKDSTLIQFGRKTRLASNESGTQLFIVGGDQSVDLESFRDVDATKEKVVLGTVKHLEYTTAKFHLGEEDKVSGPYTHQLGEESGRMPMLVYDTINQLCELVGGAYHIDVDMDGKYSAGIRD